MESILSLPKNCMVFLRIIPVKKVDEVHRIVYNTESAERISVTVHTGVNSKEYRNIKRNKKKERDRQWNKRRLIVSMNYIKSKAEGLTPEEAKEQKILRKEYMELIRVNLRSQLNNIDMEQKDGSIVNLGEKYGEKYMNKKGN